MAIKSNINIDQGSTFILEVDAFDANGVILNLSGYTANAQIRKHYNSNTYVAFSANVESNNTITLTLTANQTSNIEFGRYVYDINISNSGIVTRILEGVATITPRVTR